MAALSVNEVLYSLDKLGITSPVEKESYLKDYRECYPLAECGEEEQ